MRTQATSPSISVIVPTKNAGPDIDACLTCLFSQTLANELEILVIDSGSTDDTLRRIAEFPVRLYQIRHDEFNHGETRNLGVRLAHGQFVAMTVQDARPIDDRWLETMCAHFAEPGVAGVCGQQIVPHELGKNLL